MALSPMMVHYLETKEKYPDTILFYRLGDFYEMFFDDAKKVSALLDLTLTGKDCGLPERAPMCGIPFHAADGYIAKLVSLGEKVAVCEQLEDPSTAKGLVKRDVVKIVTAGTITENELLDEKLNNYILSVSKIDNDFGVSWADITTGEFKTQVVNFNGESDKLFDLLLNINPSEIICSHDVTSVSYENVFTKHGLLPRFYVYNDSSFTYNHAYNTLLEHFKVLNLNSFDLDNKAIISSSGALIDYLNETQKHALININNIELQQDRDYMYIDSMAARNLELTKTLRDGKRYGSLLWVLDHTETAMGSRTMNLWITRPLLNVSKIVDRQKGVEEIYSDNLLRENLIECLSQIRDTERISGKISNNNLNPKDVESLHISLAKYSILKSYLSNASSNILRKISKNITNFDKLVELLKHCIKENPPVMVKDGGYIADGFDKELDRLRQLSTNSEQIIKDIEYRERESTGIKNLKIGYNKVFGYFIEVTNSFKDKVPLSYIRKQTLVGAERYITEELKNLEDEIIGGKEKALRLENQIFEKIKALLKDNLKDIQLSSKMVAILDCLTSLAIVAKKNNYVKPEILPFGKDLNLQNGRHPVVECISGDQFIPNDTVLNTSSDRMAIITGPNMAGKSTYMRQVALITIMAHIGSFVPCESATIPLTDKIFTRVGASDNLIFNQSTFMVEMTEVATIIHKATKNSLLILDEIGRGTSTFDGLSIAWAVVEYIVKKIKAKTLFATHYHELSELEGKLDGVKNYKITCKEFNSTIIFLRKVVRGSANRSFGIEVASLAGVPSEITVKAKEILHNLEKNDLINNDYEESMKKNNESIADLIILNKLKSINIDDLTPREALDFLYDLKKDI